MCVDSWNVSGSAGHAEILSPESDPDALGFDLGPRGVSLSYTHAHAHTQPVCHCLRG